jgi:AraC family transcriptional regulator
MDFAEPKMKRFGLMHLVGMPCFSDNKRNEFKAMWDLFGPLMDRVPNRSPRRLVLGLEFYPEDILTRGQWFYMPCVQVNDLSNIPTAMAGKTIPEHEYAVFNLKGGLRGLGELFQFAYHEWLPASDYTPADRFDFEFYDERFQGGDNPATVMDVCIPVRKR